MEAAHHQPDPQDDIESHNRDTEPAQHEALDAHQMLRPDTHNTSTGSASSVRLTRNDENIATIELGTAEESAVTFNLSRIQSLRRAVTELQQDPPAALIITGQPRGMFCAGADIHTMQDVHDSKEAHALVRAGQELFQTIADLPCKKIAAIQGICVGGGCELALTADIRIATPDAVIGLPETKLGILPAWGGCQRLPRVIGLRKALDLILQGITLKGHQAKKQGLVDRLVSADKLESLAQGIANGSIEVQRHQPGAIDRLLGSNGVLGRTARSFVTNTAKKIAHRQSKGRYPAIPAAIDAIKIGLDKGVRHGLAVEAKFCSELVVGKVSRSLQHLYLVSEHAKSHGKSQTPEMNTARATIVGAGIMGAGIAGSIARAGGSVIIKDLHEDALDRAEEHIAQTFARSRSLRPEQKEEIKERLAFTTEDHPSIADSNIVLEAVVENMAVKKKVLLDLAAQVRDDSIIATNTSSLSVTEMATCIPHPERVVGMHFFNPVDKMPLVEIVRGEQTSDETVRRVAALATKMGKFPIVVEDVPGFLVNRILTPYMSESLQMLQEGYAMKDLDRAAKDFGMPMGPLQLFDTVGLDVAHHVGETMVEGYGDRMKGPDFPTAMMEAKLLGQKTGSGFYEQVEMPRGPLRKVWDFLRRRKAQTRFVPNKSALGLLGLSHEEAKPTHCTARINGKVGRFPVAEKRLILSMVNEAIRCLDEGVAGKPGADAAKQIDLGSVFGTGFAPFHGGIIRYANSIGARQLYEELSYLEARFGKRFSPAPGIKRRALSGKSFYEAA